AWRALFVSVGSFSRNSILRLLGRPLPLQSIPVRRPLGNTGTVSPPMRVFHTACIMCAAASLAVVFPSVTAIVGIATGFGSVLWTFIMPVIMILILRHRAEKERSLHKDCQTSGIRERLLSSPLSSPPMSPRQSPRFSPSPSIAEIPPMSLNGEEDSEICMHIDEPDSGKRSTVVLADRSPEKRVIELQ
ncbi:RPA190, partial [Symbiodinium pilosum]